MSNAERIARTGTIVLGIVVLAIFVIFGGAKSLQPGGAAVTNVECVLLDAPGGLLDYPVGVAAKKYLGLKKFSLTPEEEVRAEEIFTFLTAPAAWHNGECDTVQVHGLYNYNVPDFTYATIAQVINSERK